MTVSSGPKPIETRYKGYRFRSRLEARWAVFFTVLGVKWEYEPQGFDLGEAGYYLPDFWLPREELWVEIRPDSQWVFDTRCATLAEQADRLVVYIAGNPWPGDYKAGYYSQRNKDEGDDEVPPSKYSHGEFALGRRDDSALWLLRDADDVGWAACLNRNCGNVNDDHDRWPLKDFDYVPQLKRAYEAARGARFEHGETP